MATFNCDPSAERSIGIGSRHGQSGEDEMGIEVLLLAFGVYATIWLLVLWGSRYFGPR
jgi:hypothetical protein